MKIKTFKRGIHPAGNKHYTADKPITEYISSCDAVYPVSQHIGAPCEIIVNIGDEVKKGQLIAKASSYISSNIFSAVSGKVKDIKPVLTTSGAKVNSIIIENDNKFTTVDGLGEKTDFENFSKEDILEKISYAGIVGLGGAGFPTHVKLSPKNPEKIDYLIINAAECEPYLTSDYRLMIEKGDRFIEGIKLLLRLFDNAKCVIGIEDNKVDAYNHLKSINNDDRIECCLLKAKYPQGGERMLIKAITGREINSKMLPCDVGCVVVNVASVIACYDAVAYNIPLINRVVTVTGDAISEPCNLLVNLGCSHNELIKEAGGFNCDPESVVSGGPMMGISLYETDIPVTKTSSSILAFKKYDVIKNDISACIHCGACLKACPEGLIPQMLMTASDNSQFDEFERLNGMECIECGSCSYVCPAKRPLTQSFKFAKTEIVKNRRKGEKSNA